MSLMEKAGYFALQTPDQGWYTPPGSAYGQQFSRGGVKGARVSQRSDGVTFRNTEGIVTINAEVIPQLDKQRAQNLRLHNDKRIGDIADARAVHILEHELVFARKANRRFVAMNRTPSQLASVQGFTAWNAEGIPGDVHTQEQFEHGYIFLGRAKSIYEYGRPASANDGLSVQIRGACSVYNRGHHTLRYGDLVKWKLPSIDASRRSSEINTMQFPDGQQLNKLTATLEPVTFDDIHCRGMDGVTRYIAATNTNPDHPTYDPSMFSVQSDALAVDIFTRQATVRKTLFDALVGVSLFLRYFALDGDGSLAAAPQAGRELTPEEKSFHTKAVRGVATAFGLLKKNEHSAAVETIEQRENMKGRFHREVVLLANRGFIESGELFHRTRLFDPTTILQDSAEARLEKSLTSMAKTAQLSYALMMDIVNDHIIGKVISPEKLAGEVVDLDLA